MLIQTLFEAAPFEQTCGRADWAKRLRNPKAEARNPKEGRNPKSELGLIDGPPAGYGLLGTQNCRTPASALGVGSPASDLDWDATP